MVNLLHVRDVAVPLEHLAGALDRGEEGVHPYGEVGRPYQRRALLPELGEHVLLYVIPAGCPYNRRLELARYLGIVGPEGVGSREIYADAFRREPVGNRADVFGDAGRLDATPVKRGLHHVAHLSVSANYNFHISSYSFQQLRLFRRGLRTRRRGGPP